MKNQKVIVLAAVLLASSLAADAGNAQKPFWATGRTAAVHGTNNSVFAAPLTGCGALSVTNTNSPALRMSWAWVGTNANSWAETSTNSWAGTSTNSTALLHLSLVGAGTNTNSTALKYLSWTGRGTNTNSTALQYVSCVAVGTNTDSTALLHL
ncbi:MAG TPA: hypothetical protein VN578_01150 [Candidatus Binatia bacterium]|jgi:hypothetical protein|nr:hypothetical protein [Candidatus Binatia bacterium]